MSKEGKDLKPNLPKKSPEIINENNLTIPETNKVSRQLDYLPTYKEDEFNNEELYKQIEEIKNSSVFIRVPHSEGHYRFSPDAVLKGEEFIEKLDAMHKKLINLKNQYEEILKDNSVANKKDIETILSKINEKLGIGSDNSLEQKITTFRYDFIRGSIFQ